MIAVHTLQPGILWLWYLRHDFIQYFFYDDLRYITYDLYFDVWWIMIFLNDFKTKFLDCIFGMLHLRTFGVHPTYLHWVNPVELTRLGWLSWLSGFDRLTFTVTKFGFKCILGFWLRFGAFHWNRSRLQLRFGVNTSSAFVQFARWVFLNVLAGWRH